jgi:hypothetical protein
MEEQDDLKKRAGTEFYGPFRRIKRPTSGPIPKAVRNSNGHMYIVTAFEEEMRGKKIPDKMVVKAANGRWFTEQEKIDFQMKSTPRCPTYGVCTVCLSSGPVHMLCQKCKEEGRRYYIPRIGGVCGKLLDAEWISRFFGTTHVDVRADKAQNWLTQKIWDLSERKIEDYIKNVWPARKLLRERDENYCSGVLDVFMQGTRVEYHGMWDADDHPVEVFQWDDPDRYRGKNGDDEYD